jgi:hypothetical protein
MFQAISKPRFKRGEAQADLHGVKAKHLISPTNKAQKHGRGGLKLIEAKKVLEKMKRSAK